MYGTVAHFRPSPGQEQAIVSLFEEWYRERRPVVKGALGGYLFRKDEAPGELIAIALFENKETYVDNAGDPEQDKWYGRVREHLEADPTWEDGEIIASA